MKQRMNPLKETASRKFLKSQPERAHEECRKRERVEEEKRKAKKEKQGLRT